MGGTEKKSRQQGRCLNEKKKRMDKKKHETGREGQTGGSEAEKRSGIGKREREEEVPSVSLRAPAGGTSSCLPSERRFLLHFK